MAEDVAARAGPSTTKSGRSPRGGDQVSDGPCRGGRARRTPAGIGDLLFPAINFAIFAFVLARFLGGPDPRVLPRADRTACATGWSRPAGPAAGPAASQAQLDREMRRAAGGAGALKADLLAIRRGGARRRSLEQGRRAAERIRADAKLVAEQEGRRSARSGPRSARSDPASDDDRPRASSAPRTRAVRTRLRGEPEARSA